MRALHNHHLSFPDTDLFQNEGLATIDPWIPPNFLGGANPVKKMNIKFAHTYNKYTILLDK
jgi:hypothetical protein